LGIEEVDTEQELEPAQARKLLSFVIANGEVIYSPHARKEMAEDKHSRSGRRERASSRSYL
jgi:hypothetical protein